MKNNLKIRKANKCDVSELNSLNLRSFEELTKKLDFSKFIGNSNYTIIIASKKKDIVGYLLTLKLTINLHEIISIAVDSTHKRKGVASLLLSEFLVNEKVNSVTRNKNQIFLYTENDEYQPIEVDLSQQNFAIEGLSVGVIRQRI